MIKSFCENPECRFYGKEELEGQGVRVHDEDTGKKIESKEYLGRHFCSLCCPDEQTAKAIVEKHF